MFSVRNNIFQVPGNPFGEWVLADFAVCFNADGTTVRDAVVFMNKEFDGGSEFFFDQRSQRVHFGMRLPYIQVPGIGHVAVNVQDITKFDHPQVVDINPVGLAVAVQQADHPDQYLVVCFVHNAGNGLAGNPVADEHDHERHDDGNDTVHLLDAGKVDEQQAGNQRKRRISIRLQVAAAGFQRV